MPPFSGTVVPNSMKEVAPVHTEPPVRIHTDTPKIGEAIFAAMTAGTESTPDPIGRPMTEAKHCRTLGLNPPDPLMTKGGGGECDIGNLNILR